MEPISKSMTDKEELLVNHLIAAGGWIRRATDKYKDLSIYQAAYALAMAQLAIEESLKILNTGTHEQSEHTF